MELYLDLKEKIEERIEEIDNYYELNFDKPNSQYFEKGRMKLKKLLMYEPSSISEMNIEINNKKIKKALVVNETNKNTIESEHNYNNSNYDSINVSQKGEILNKSMYEKNNFNKRNKVKMKFIPLKEKKWKKTKSIEKSKIDKDDENIYINSYKYKKANDGQNNHIYINKQSNLYINKNYNLYPMDKKDNIINKLTKKSKKNSYIENNYKSNKSSSSINSQDNSFNNYKYI